MHKQIDRHVLEVYKVQNAPSCLGLRHCRVILPEQAHQLANHSSCKADFLFKFFRVRNDGGTYFIHDILDHFTRSLGNIRFVRQLGRLAEGRYLGFGRAAVEIVPLTALCGCPDSFENLRIALERREVFLRELFVRCRNVTGDGVARKAVFRRLFHIFQHRLSPHRPGRVACGIGVFEGGHDVLREREGAYVEIQLLDQIGQLAVVPVPDQLLHQLKKVVVPFGVVAFEHVVDAVFPDDFKLGIVRDAKIGGDIQLVEIIPHQLAAE